MLHLDLNVFTPTTSHLLRMLDAFKNWGITKLVIDWGDTHFLIYSNKDIEKIFGFMKSNNIEHILCHSPQCLSNYDLTWYTKSLKTLPKVSGTYLTLNRCGCDSCLSKDPKGMLDIYLSKTKLVKTLFLDCNNFLSTESGTIVNIPKNITPLNFLEKLGKNIPEHIFFKVLSEETPYISDLILVRNELRKIIWDIFANDADSFELLENINNLIHLHRNKVCIKIGKIGEGILGHSISSGVYVSNMYACDGKYYIQNNIIHSSDGFYYTFPQPILYFTHNWKNHLIILSGDKLYKLSKNLQECICIRSEIQGAVDITAYKNEIYILGHSELLLCHSNEIISVPYPAYKICHNGDKLLFLVCRDNLYILNPKLPEKIIAINIGGWINCKNIVVEKEHIFAQFLGDKLKDVIVEYKCVEK